MNTKTRLLVMTVVALCFPITPSNACCPYPHVSIWTKRHWVVPDEWVGVTAYENSGTYINHWDWDSSDVRPLDTDGCDSGRANLYLYCEGWFRYNFVNLYKAVVNVRNDCGRSSTDTGYNYVVTMAISPEPWFIPVNDDDDDGDGWMDMFNRGDLTYGGPLVQGQDDDLVQFNLSVNALQTYYNDKVELAILTAPESLRVWADRTRTSRVLPTATGYSKKWTPGSQTTPIYMEGKSPSSGYQTSDPKSRWQYWGDNSYALTGWDPDSWITVVHVDMDLAGVKDEEYSSPDPGKTEETTPGGFIPLGDFVQLTVKPVSPSAVEDVDPETWPDMTLSVEYTGDGRIEIWDDTEKKDPPYPVSPASNLTLRVKGTHVSSSLRDVTLCLTHTATAFKDKINLTVCGIKSVDFEKYMDNTDLDANPNQGGGKRIFPDKQTYGDESPDRRKVRVVATYIGPVLENRHVYFKSFDVDDPSTSTVIDTNGNVGNDNHPPGAGTLSPVEIVTDGDGKARVTLTVGMAPGDNYRVAASLDSTKVQEPYLTQTMADTDAPPPGVVFSPMLTVWRKLHVELDSMEAVLTSGAEQNQVVGTADSYAYNSGTNETTVDLGQDLDDCWEEDKASHFENGSYTPSGASSYTPLRTIGHYGDDDLVVQGNCSLSKDYVLRDDDSFTLLPRLPDTGLLNSVFDDCYILCVNDAPGSNDDVPFKRNLGGQTTNSADVLAAADIGSDSYEADDYWAAYILSGYQLGYDYDRDPDAEGGPAGGTDQDHYQASVVVLENIRDAATYVPGLDATILEQQTVVHEIGHQILESGAHTPATIMNALLPVQSSQCKFSDADIHSIRNQSSSPGK